MTIIFVFYWLPFTFNTAEPSTYELNDHNDTAPKHNPYAVIVDYKYTYNTEEAGLCELSHLLRIFHVCK